MKKIIWRNLVDENQILHVASVTFPKKESTGLHTHDFAEFFLVLDGEGVHKVNGYEQKIKSNDLLLIRPNDKHTIMGKLNILNVAFPRQALDFLKKRYYSGNTNFWGGCEALPRIIKLSIAHCQWLERELLNLNPVVCSQLQLDRFLLNLLDTIESLPNKQQYQGPEWLLVACKDIKLPENFREGVPGLIHLAKRSPEHVARVLKQVTGKTPTEIVTEARMEYATAQLRLTNRTILDICLDCGFKSLSYFYMVFKEYYKLSPRQYRLQNQTIW